MKPIGTITMDFQFIGKFPSQFLIKSMKHAADYSTYVHLLCEQVMAQEGSGDKFVLIALRHSDNLGKRQLYSKILDKYRNRDILYPYYLANLVAEKDEWVNILSEIERINQKCEDDWVRYGYLILSYWLAHTRAIDGFLAETAEVQIEELVQKNDSLRCYLSQLHYLKSQRLRYEGDVEKAIEACDAALELAREHDDRYFESRALKELGALIGFYSFGPSRIEVAKPYLRGAREICDELGDIRGKMEVLSYIGGICATRGEFLESKSINLEVLGLREKLGDIPMTEFHNASMAAIELGNGREALEWAMTGLENVDSRPLLLPYLHLDKAAALVLLNRLDEAEVHVDIARELNLKAGLESGLAFEYMVVGLLERARGDFDSAFHSFESALEINERNARFPRMVICLMRLAETEVATFEPTLKNRDDDVSGIWLERFDRLAREKELPGFIGYALCLKSELRFKQGRHEEAQQLISEVLHMSTKQGLAPLRDKALVIQDLRVPRERS